MTAEIGDTWLFGADSDPYKVAMFRAASRAHGQCIRDGGDAACLATTATADADADADADANDSSSSQAPSDDDDVAALRTFERLLMIGTEHT